MRQAAELCCLVVDLLRQITDNQIAWFPAELAHAKRLRILWVRLCCPSPHHFGLFSLTNNAKHRQLAGNPLPTVDGLDLSETYASAEDCVLRFQDILAATTHIGFIRERATEICIGLQDLDLPAFVTLQIIDEAVHENSIRMWAKWELITAVKHFTSR